MKPAWIKYGAFLCVLAQASFALGQPAAQASAPSSFVLTPENFHRYVTQFQAEEKLARETAHVGSPANSDDPWQWMLANIPWFESSNEDFEQIYYFRWFAFQKHIVHTDQGDLLSEFLIRVKWAGKGGTVVDAAPHHLREARWLRDPKLAEDYARFWFSPAAPHVRDYSVALADAVHDVTLATGDTKLGTSLLPAMVDNYKTWAATHQDSNGLFWSIDTRDGMEISISGDGYRPTLNSYMYGDAKAISRFAEMLGEHTLSAEFAKKADEQKQRVETILWNPRDQFYEVVAPAADSLIRKQPKFKDRGTSMAISNVRELIGYVPWYYGIPSPDHAVAWSQIVNLQGFAGAYGPTTAERRSPRFRYANPDLCPWNGPMWGFATTQTLVAMANMMNDQKQNVVTKRDYMQVFSAYVHSHQLKLPDGEVIPWLDEAMDPDTGEWITRDGFIRGNSPLQGRGAYYNHSGFVDPLLTGLIGLRPREDNLIVLNPLLPKGVWRYFAVDGLPYHGHILTILYDPSGRRYHRGKGLILFVDGKKATSRAELGPLHAKAGVKLRRTQE